MAEKNRTTKGEPSVNERFRMRIDAPAGAMTLAFDRIQPGGVWNAVILRQVRESGGALYCLCADPPIRMHIRMEKQGATIAMELATDAAHAGAHHPDCPAAKAPVWSAPAFSKLVGKTVAKTSRVRPEAVAAITPPTDGVWREKSALTRLNDAQRAAAAHGDGPALVIAAAGSGKTAMLIARIGLLLARGVNPRQMAACTFTTRATAEMEERLQRVLGCVPVTVGTMHSLAFRMVMPAYPDDWRMVSDSAWMVQKATEPPHPTHNPHGLGRVTLDVRDGQAAISLAKANGLQPAQVPGEVGELYAAYEAIKRDAKRLDFDDLLLEAVRLFRESASFAATWQGKWTHVLVDEFQDTNLVQWQFLQALAAHHRNLFAVGDDWQSIYGFRGARPELMRAFSDVYPDAMIFRLETNYRSHDLIVDLGSQIIERNRDRQLDKQVVAHRQATDTAIAQVVTVADEAEEAVWVVREIEKSRRERPTVPLSEYAILYRINVQSRAFEEALTEADLPYQLVGDTHFYESRDVQTLLAYLRTALDVSNPDIWIPILNRPMRYLSRETRERARRDGWNVLLHDEKGQAFAATIERLRTKDSPVEAIRWLIDTQEGIVRPSDEPLQWIDSLVAAARKHDTYRSFLRYVDWVIEKSKEPKDDAVWLSTIHASKGLEFDTVFLVGLAEGLLPYKKAQTPVELAEETRLAYVAVTRAKENLHLLHARQYGETPMAPSSFLESLE